MSVQGTTRLNPASTLGYVEMLLRAKIQRARNRVFEGPRDVGASVVEWVIISAVVIGIAVAVGTALKGKLTDEVSNLNLTDQTK